MMTCETCRDQLAEFSLDQIGADQRAAVAEHLRECSVCREELAELQAAWTLLPLALSSAAPSPELYQRIASRLAPEGELGPDAQGEAAIVQFRPSRRERVLSYLLAASVLIGLTVGAAAYVRLVREGAQDLSADRSVRDLERRLANLHRMERLLESDNVRLVSLRKPQSPDDVQAYVVWDLVANQGHIYAFDLPPAPQGFSYQLWTTGNGGAYTAGPKFAVTKEGLGSAVVDLPAPIGGAAAKAVVTLEPHGESKEPTGKVMLEARF